MFRFAHVVLKIHFCLFQEKPDTRQMKMFKCVANPFFTIFSVAFTEMINHQLVFNQWVVLSDWVLLLLFPNVMEDRSLLVVYVFTSSNSPRGPPWNEGHQPKVRHETSVLEVPAQEQHEHSFCSSSTNAFITYSPYRVRRYCTSLGTPDLRARLG